jgi:predicted nucleic acid-binding protein
VRAFIDTSAFLAILNAGDLQHPKAAAVWRRELSSDTRFTTTSYVLLETIALLQHRIGMEAVRVFEREVVPAVDVEWVDAGSHRAGMSAMLAAGRKTLSLVDCVSFEVMRTLGLTRCFTFDRHFARQGFKQL